MDGVIDPGEPISRFLRNSSHMRTALGRPHFSAYMPPVPDGDISVYRTVGMEMVEIAELGAQYVAVAAYPLKGHCDLAADGFFRESLNIVSDPNPHVRHANVTGWTRDPRNRIVAKKLADKAVLVVY